MSKPELIIALIKAHAPGIGTICIPSFIAFFTIISPGSDITGVPASETKAMHLPSFNSLISPSTFISSLCLW